MDLFDSQSSPERKNVSGIVSTVTEEYSDWHRRNYAWRSWEKVAHSKRWSTVSEVSLLRFSIVRRTSSSSSMNNFPVIGLVFSTEENRMFAMERTLDLSLWVLCCSFKSAFKQIYLAFSTAIESFLLNYQWRVTLLTMRKKSSSKWSADSGKAWAVSPCCTFDNYPQQVKWLEWRWKLKNWSMSKWSRQTKKELNDLLRMSERIRSVSNCSSFSFVQRARFATRWNSPLPWKSHRSISEDTRSVRPILRRSVKSNRLVWRTIEETIAAWFEQMICRRDKRKLSTE